MNKRVTLDMLQSLVFDIQRQKADTLFKNGTYGATRSTSTAVQPSLHLVPPEPETPEELFKLKEALSVLSSDVPRGNGSLYVNGQSAPSSDYWLLVIWAIASLQWSCGKEIAREWSQQSPRYTHDGFERDWNGYDPTRAKSVGIGSLYALAKHHGWSVTQASVAVPPYMIALPEFRLQTAQEIMSQPPIQWCVKKLLPAIGLAAVYGPSGSGKSFLVLDLAHAVATGKKWFGIKATQSPVVYIALEGEAGLRTRLEALAKAKGHAIENNFKFLTDPFRLTEPKHIAALAEQIPHGAVVFIDTLNRAAPTADENTSKDMGVILEAAKLLQRSCNGLVVLVHHTGKDAARGLRGHSSLHAALDAAIEVERLANGGNVWTASKSKEGADGGQRLFKLESIMLGVDADGEEITSCHVVPDTSGVLAKREPTGRNQRKALKVIKARFGSTPAPTNGVVEIKFDDLVADVAKALTGVESKRRTSEARRLVKDLADDGYLGTRYDGGGDICFPA